MTRYLIVKVIEFSVLYDEVRQIESFHNYPSIWFYII